MALAREDLSGWVEGCALRDNDSKSIATFMFKDVICRHGMPLRVVSDGGPENRGVAHELFMRYGIKHTWTSAYHPQGNGMVERGHQPVVNALAKHTHDTGRNWVDSLPAMLWADRTTVKSTTGMTPTRVIYGSEHILPVEIHVQSWKTASWATVRTTSDLLAARCHQLDRRDEALEEVLLRVRRQREASKEPYDDAHRVRTEEFAAEDIVLLWDARREVNKSSAVKLHPRWLGPYKIVTVTESFGSYRIAELDGAILKGTFAGKRLKKLKLRQDVDGQDLPAKAPTSVIEPAVPRVLRERGAPANGETEAAELSQPVVLIPPPPPEATNAPFFAYDSDQTMEDDDAGNDSTTSEVSL